MQEHVNTFKGSETMWFFCDGAHPENHAISALPSLASGIEPRSHLGLAIAEASWDYYISMDIIMDIISLLPINSRQKYHAYGRITI